MRLTARLILSLSVFTFAAPSAWAQAAFPNKPIKIVVPFPAGGTSDVLARLVGQKMSESWGQPVVVENRPGAGGTLGATQVARAEADGHTLLVVSTGHVVNPGQCL